MGAWPIGWMLSTQPPGAVRGKNRTSTGVAGEGRPDLGRPLPVLGLGNLPERPDDLAVLGFGEGFQGFGRDVPQCASREREPGAGFVAGELREENGIVLAHGEIPRVDLSPFAFSGFLGGVEAGRAVLDFGNSLLGVADQGHIVWHGIPPSCGRNVTRVGVASQRDYPQPGRGPRINLFSTECHSCARGNTGIYFGRVRNQPLRSPRMNKVLEVLLSAFALVGLFCAVTNRAPTNPTIRAKQAVVVADGTAPMPICRGKRCF